MNMEILGGLCLIVKNKDLAAVTIYPYKHRCLAHCSQGQKAYISYYQQAFYLQLHNLPSQKRGPRPTTSQCDISLLFFNMNPYPSVISRISSMT